MVSMTFFVLQIDTFTFSCYFASLGKMKEEEGEEEEEVEMEDGEENTPEEEQKSKKIPPRKRQLEHKNRFISVRKINYRG